MFIYLEEESKNAGDLELSDMSGLKVEKQGNRLKVFDCIYCPDLCHYILEESANNSTEDLITSGKTPEDASDGGWFSKQQKPEDATEPDWVTLTWRSKLPRFLPFSLFIPGELYRWRL